jgi:hypothetical protein
MEIPELKTPTPDLVREYNRRFESNDDLVFSDRAIRCIVDLFPGNQKIEEVYLKVTLINSLYNTYLYKILPMVNQIVMKKIDIRLKIHDPSLVNEIAKLQTRNCYSFATKYCSWHAQDGYPIYDGFVDQLLRAYRQRDGFEPFNNKELRNYPKFKTIIQSFQHRYGLEDFSFKEIDKFLWLYGKEKFPPKKIENKKAAKN